MEKKVDNINIEKNKELFEYEMTEVILKLKGEFAAFSGKNTKYVEIAVDKQRLAINTPTISEIPSSEKPVEIPKLPEMLSLDYYQDDEEKQNENTNSIRIPKLISISPIRIIDKRNLHIIKGIGMPFVPSKTCNIELINKKISAAVPVTLKKEDTLEISDLSEINSSAEIIGTLEADSIISIVVPEIKFNLFAIADTVRILDIPLGIELEKSPEIPEGINEVYSLKKNDGKFSVNRSIINIPLVTNNTKISIERVFDTPKRFPIFPNVKEMKKINSSFAVELENLNKTAIPKVKVGVQDIGIVVLQENTSGIPMIPTIKNKNICEVRISDIKTEVPDVTNLIKIKMNSRVDVEHKSVEFPQIEKIDPVLIKNALLMESNIRMLNTFELKDKLNVKKPVIVETRVDVPIIAGRDACQIKIDAVTLMGVPITVPRVKIHTLQDIGKISMTKMPTSHISNEFTVSIHPLKSVTVAETMVLLPKIEKPEPPTIGAGKNHKKVSILDIEVPQSIPGDTIAKVSMKRMFQVTVPEKPQVNKIIENIISLARA